MFTSNVGYSDLLQLRYRNVQPADVDTDHGDSKSSRQAKPLLFCAELLMCCPDSSLCLRANTQAKSPSDNVHQESCGIIDLQRSQETQNPPRATSWGFDPPPGTNKV